MSRITELARTITAYPERRRLVNVEKVLLAELESSLGLPGKLAEINRNVLQGTGWVWRSKRVVTTEKSYGGIGLSTHNFTSVCELKESVYKDELVVGEEEPSPYDRYDWSQGHRSKQWIRSYKGEKTVGVDFDEYVEPHLIVFYKVSPQQNAQVWIIGYANQGLSPQDFGDRVDSGLKVRVISKKELEKQKLALDPDFINWLTKTWSSGDNSHDVCVGISFSPDQRNSDALNSLVNAVLKRIIIDKQQIIAEQIATTAYCKAQIREIKSRMGRVS
jgi:hypothetical protein